MHNIRWSSFWGPLHYDYLDSYADEFQRIANEAQQKYSSLVGVHEVEDDFYSTPESRWRELGCSDLEQVFFDIDSEFSDYGKNGLDANLAGSTVAFLTTSGEMKSVILIRKNIPTSFKHADLKYALKIASLCHEVGHVHDLEHEINFDLNSKTLDLVEAEIFAHKFALQMMTERALRQSYHMLWDALTSAVAAPGYLGPIASRVVSEHCSDSLVDWQSVLEVAPTAEEARLLGPITLRALS